MKLPEQIQKQVEAAGKIIAAHEASQQQEPEPPAEPTSVTQGQPAEPSPDISKQSPAPQAIPSEMDDENSTTYKQRWKSLDGQLRAAYAREQELRNRLVQMEQLIASMAAMQQQPAQPARATQRRISDAEREAYGSDLVGMVERAAQDVVDEENAALRKQVAQLSEQMRQLNGVVPVIAQNQTLSAKERFFQQLSQMVPDWEQVNADQRFLNWLLEADPMTGITRQTYLADAQDNYDARRAATILHSWKGTLTGGTETQHRANPNAAQSELEKQVAPGRSLSAPAPTDNQKKTWSPEEVRRFYADVRNGVYKGRDAERAELERDIFAAGRDGRIRPAAA